MAEHTPVFSFNLPTPCGDREIWGALLNENFKKLDTLVSLNRKRATSWGLPYLPAAGTFQTLGFRSTLVASGALVAGPPTTVSVGVSKLSFNIKLGGDLSGVLTLAGDSRHPSTGALVLGDSETIAVIAAGVYTSGKVWVGDVDISTTNLAISDYDILSLSLFGNAGQPFELESVQLLGTSLVAGLTASVVVERYRKVPAGFAVTDLLSGILDIAATPAGVRNWDMTYDLAQPLIQSDIGEGLIGTVALTGSAGDWRDLRLALNYKIKPNAT